MPGRGGYERGPGGGAGSFWDWIIGREPRIRMVGGHVEVRGMMRVGDVEEITRLVRAEHEKRMKAMG